MFIFKNNQTPLDEEVLNHLVMHEVINDFNLNTPAGESGNTIRMFYISAGAANGPSANCPAGTLIHSADVQLFIPSGTNATIWHRTKNGTWNAWRSVTGPQGVQGPPCAKYNQKNVLMDLSFNNGTLTIRTTEV